MLAATHADFSTSFYLGGVAVFEYPTDPVFIYAGYWHSDIEGRAAAVFFISVPLRDGVWVKFPCATRPINLTTAETKMLHALLIICAFIFMLANFDTFHCSQDPITS